MDVHAHVAGMDILIGLNIFSFYKGSKIEVSSITMHAHIFRIKSVQSERNSNRIYYITRQLNKYQEQEDLPRWFAEQMSVAKQRNRPHPVDQKSLRSKFKGKYF